MNEYQTAQTAAEPVRPRPAEDEGRAGEPDAGNRPEDQADVRSQARAEDGRQAEGEVTGPAAGGTPALASQQERRTEAADGDLKPPAEAETRLIGMDAASAYRERWTEIQATFVDEPKQTLEQADGLVAEVIQLLTRNFADERSKLEAQWTSGAQVSTEEMRLAFQRYRTFFNALLR
jgi:hypothetical protein